MARTVRKYMTRGNFREARKGKVRVGSWGSWDPQADIAWAPRGRNHGGLLMPRASGEYMDELPSAGSALGKRLKRAAKRRDRRMAFNLIDRKETS